MPSVRKELQATVGALVAADSLCLAVLGKDPEQSKTDPDARRREYLAAQTDGRGARGISLMANMQKIFSERVPVYGEVAYSRRAATLGIVKAVLRAFSEAVRLQTFDQAGQKQVEVDAHFFGMEIWPLVGEEAEEEVTTLLRQVISGATARCLDPAAVSAAELLAVLDGE